MTTAAGVFVVFHGLVHAMYVGQALRWFELREGMKWPLGARLLRSLSDNGLRVFAATTIGITSLALVVGGVGILLGAGWGPCVTAMSAVLVSLPHLLLWDGDLKTSPDQGLYGIVINVVIVVWILATR